MNTEFDKIEKFLESNLSDYEVQPSPKVWNKIASELFFKSGLFYTLGIGMIILIGLGINQYLNTKETLNTTLTTNQIKPLNTNRNISLASTSDKSPSPTVTQKTETIKITDNSSIHKNTSTKELKKQTNTIKKQNIAITSNKQTSIINQSKQAGLLQKKSVEKPIQLKNLFISNLLMRNSFSLFLPRTSFKYSNRPSKIFPNHYVSNKNSIIIGGFINPEFIFEKNKKTKKAINLDLLGTYGSAFFIQSGLGISFSEDQGNYHINYAQNDSIGFYEKVDSFTMGENGTPIFNTSTEAVFDTVQYNTDEEVMNTFTYLRFPLYLGYSVKELKRISLDLKAGIIYSLLLNSNIPTPQYSNQKATEINIQNQSLRRVHSYRQFSLALTFNYQLSDKTKFSIEPIYSYYTQSIYTNNPQTPWSLGLRFGLKYKIR